MDETVDSAATSVVLTDLLDDLRSVLQVETAAILLTDESGQFLVATAARGIEEEVRQGSRVPVGVGFAGRVAAELAPMAIEEISPTNVVNPLLLRRGIVSMLGVPLLRQGGGGPAIGVMHVGSLTRRTFGADDISTMQRVAVEVTDSILRHRSSLDRLAATALQQSLTPRLPRIDGLDLAARYVPSSQYGVGGDWYDVFQLDSGLVCITIGDVMGHGLHAATVMGRARSALRSYALEYDDPAVVLDRLDRKMQHFEPGLIGTVCYAVLDSATGELMVSSAGHLPPIITCDATTSRQLPITPDTPIGVSPCGPRRTLKTALPEGALLCFYTDGLVEQRDDEIHERLRTLGRTLASASTSGSCEWACAELMTAMVHDRDTRDDVSVLVVSRRRA